MELSGIDIQTYSTHSTRSAASSKAKFMGTSLKNIKYAGWKSEKTFAQHYDKQIEEFSIGHVNIVNNILG